MSEVSVTNLLPLFTNEIVAKFSDHTKPKSYGRSMFKEVVTATKLSSIMSQRGINTVASDVPRGTRGDFMTWDKSSQIQTLPPYYDVPFSLSEMDSYDYLRVAGVKSKIAFGAFIDEYSQKLESTMDTIERRYEIQCWQALDTGIVTLASGQNISFGRKAESKVTLTGADLWSANGVDPWAIFKTAGIFLTETGKCTDGVFNVTMGRDAFEYYSTNPKVVDRAKQVQWGLETLKPVTRDSIGKLYHGYASIGQWRFNFFSYADFYENSDGSVKTPYMNPKKIIITPENPSNVLTYTAVPGLISMGAPKAQKYTVLNKVDPMNETEITIVKSAGIAQLVAVDQVFTAQVLD